MIDIDFHWSRARKYECAEVGGVRVIREAGDKRENIEPFKINGDRPMYLRFSDLDGSEESCLRFAHVFGLLRQKAGYEPLADWQNEIRTFKNFTKYLGAGEKVPGGVLRRRIGPYGFETKLTTINVVLVPGEIGYEGLPGRPKMLLEPGNLRDAIWLQLGKFISSYGTLMPCQSCGKWFERGASESRRGDAIYCSKPCKDRAFYQAKRRATQ